MKIRSNPYRQVPLWLGLPLLLICIATVVISVPAYLRVTGINQELATQGVVVQATITYQLIQSQHTSGVAGRPGNSYDQPVLGYDFTANGRVYSIRQDVSRERYDAYALNDPVTVRYLARDPNIAVIDGTTYMDANIAIYAAIGMGLIALMIVNDLRKPIDPAKLRKRRRVVAT